MSRGSYAGRWLAVGGFCVAVISVIISIALNPPAEVRKENLSYLRQQDLQAIDRNITSYWTTKKALPPNLKASSDGLYTIDKLRDPESGRPYVYEVVNANTYRLCASPTDDMELKAAGWYSRTVDAVRQSCLDHSLPVTSPKMFAP